MKMKSLIAFGLSFAFAGGAFAADEPKKPVKHGEETYLTAEEAPADFKYQGEYGEAEAGKAKYGVQVIALQDGKFRAVIFPGGLPGAGFSGDKSTKEEFEGVLGDGKISIVAKGWTSITIDGQTATLKKGGFDDVVLKKIVRQSPTLGLKPPAGAKVLYGGPDDVKNWKGGHADARGLLAAVTSSVDKFGSFTLHAEFLLPFKPGGRGQGRANSGVYLQDRYECQVLDSFGLKGENNECGGFYQQFAPSVNMCFPPLQWQTYDIEFTAAKFGPDGKRTEPARATVKHNGVVIQDNVEFKGPTPGGGLSGKDNADPGAIQLQGHGNPVFFQNIWIVEK
jgi:hypothetical protein